MNNRILKSNIFNKGHGLKEELLKEILREDLNYLQLGGYIRIGISPNGETFSLTKKGKKMLYLYSDKINIKDKILDFIFKYIIRFNVSI